MQTQQPTQAWLRQQVRDLDGQIIDVQGRIDRASGEPRDLLKWKLQSLQIKRKRFLADIEDQQESADSGWLGEVRDRVENTWQSLVSTVRDLTP